MYKVMVVDDESWGRKSISKMISELALDVEVIAEAKHGEEALKLIQLNKPHIIVTDMNMPVMNGQLFLETLHAVHCDIKVIVISGYSQFEYLKAAIRYQACEYLLKPVSLAELRSSMVKATESIRSYMSLQQQQKETRDLWKLKRGVFLQNVTSRRITNKSDIDQQTEELRIANTVGSYRLVVIMFRQFHEAARTNFHGNADLLMYSIENILQELMRDELALVYKSDDRMRICLILDETLSNDETRGWLTEFNNAVHRMLKLDILVGISPVYETLLELPEAFRTANQAIEQQGLHTTELLISLAEAAGEGKGEQILTSFDRQALRQALAAGNVKDSRALLNDYGQKVSASTHITLGKVHQELAMIMEIASSELKGMAVALPSLFHADTLTGVMDDQALRVLLNQWIEAIERYGAHRKESESVQLIQDIVVFLDNHYFEDVSLIDVATRFHMDPSYLSKLFKTVTQENFIEYVTRKRIEKACELLHSFDRKISDISELVGYENQRYFSQVFKKSTGQTPSEYRESQLNPQ